MSLTDKMRHCHLTHSGLWAKLAAQNKADAGDVLPTAEQRVFSMAASCAVAPISRGNLGGPAARAALWGAVVTAASLSIPEHGFGRGGKSRRLTEQVCEVVWGPRGSSEADAMEVDSVFFSRSCWTLSRTSFIAAGALFFPLKTPSR